MEDPVTARLKNLVTSSNDALEFKLVRSVEDLENDEATFRPEMSHQVFGDSESIFGYRDLRVKLYYSAGCLETYLGMTYSEKINKAIYEGVEADEVLPKIADKLAPQVHDSLDSFIKSLKKDDTFIPHGELLHSFSVNDDGCTRKFEVYKADMTYKGFREYHERIRTFVLWYIDAANFIDIDDDRWHYFNMFEKYILDGTVRYATTGFATVYQYYAYPRHTRPRIAQVLILPPFQNMGLCANLLHAIYREYIGRQEVIDIAVEDPSVSFQRIRDYVDAMNCSSTLPSFSRECLLQGFNKAMAVEAKEKLKINKKQARRVYEILRLRATDLTNEQEYRDYRLDVKKRLNIPYRREQNDFKKLECALKNIDKRGNITLPTSEQRIQTLEQEYRSLEEEYKKVIRRLEDAEEL
ncbi:histone acetyltransferase type B catalytic subunit [Osmia bicornis bicornis]|uniref:histone acetyltransferase type B catalytic subunit n=1 Tax=Osmia bicornis bicornis TaxID=1437191 RepID=UPI001EAF7511|nr:histone acetyltransferase type B catalytic subunit [Osmia bicornis bicornis]XP_029043897.2 histone acetyltransferase type B catalytic subunit [Osmia bicornis bicornis]XP_029043898.2 histone acetyltransferase type B catalytic subunit [Osmia bicornis bicornis]XP_029043899.2 histone acetyltransferase type B catalytic subunit [Osmia bicornis bicornis]